MTSTDTDLHAGADPAAGAAAPAHDHPSDDDHDPGSADDLAVTVERRPGSQVALTVVAAAKDVDAAVAHALQHLGRRYRFPGFRPGKAPAAVVERTVGWPTVAQEAMETLVPGVYSRALREARLAAVSDPQLQIGDQGLEKGHPFTFTAVVTVEPEVDLGDYTTIRVERETTAVEDDRVDEMIESIRRRHSEVVDVDRPAQSGDVLKATLVMRRGEEVLGGENEERDLELDRDQLLPGLADGLIGLSAGESSSVEITLPDSYANEALRGQVVRVDSTLHAVRERPLPPLDDSLAVLDGHGTTLEELRAWCREHLEEVAARQDEERFEGAVLEALVERASVEVPALMIDREVDRQLRDMELRLSGSGLQLQRYLEYTGETLEQVRAARRPAAEQRVHLELVLAALAEAEGIEIDEADVMRQEATVIGERPVTDEQRHRIHLAAHRDLLLQAAGQRALEIGRGEV